MCLFAASANKLTLGLYHCRSFTQDANSASVAVADKFLTCLADLQTERQGAGRWFFRHAFSRHSILSVGTRGYRPMVLALTTFEPQT
jgi:hypothetical protein